MIFRVIKNMLFYTIVCLLLMDVVPEIALGGNGKIYTAEKATSDEFGSASSYDKPGQAPEIDILKEHGEGHIFSSATIISALNKYGTDNKVVFVLSPGTWKLYGVLEIPSNVTVKLQKGALLSLEYGSRIVFDGHIVAGTNQIFTGPGTVFFRQNRRDVYPQWWKSANDRNYFPAIQKAVSCGARGVFFPKGVYEVSIRKEYRDKSLIIPSNIRLHGEGDQSVIKLVETPRTDGVWAANDMFLGKDIVNVEIANLSFNGEKFYPNPEVTSRMEPSIRGTRALRISNGENIKLSGCSFRGFTNGSAYISAKGVTISRNTFFHGSYRTQTVRLDKSKNVTVSDNVFDDNGPHYYMVLGSSNEMASVDALMVGYQAENAQITNNRITNTAAIGIRVENSKNVHVVGNVLDNIGESGIVFYRKTYDSHCKGNVISNWGKSNNLSYIRKQNGKIYNPKEHHYPPPNSPSLPDRLDTAATWELNRYFLQGRDESTIPEYDPKDYKTTLAFRGYAAISVEELSERVTISENRIFGSTSKDGDQYKYASNFGISIGVASINPPTMSGDCVITGNIIKNCIDYDIYCPQYVDPVGKRGIAKPSRVFGNDCDPAKIDFFYVKS